MTKDLKKKKKKERVKDERDARVCNIHQTPKITG